MLKSALERPILLVIAAIIIGLLGVISVFQVPVQMIPDIEPRIVTVETHWPGATPQDVEKEIIVLQEEYLHSIAGLERMTSSTSFGNAKVELVFPFGVDVNEALILVNNALSQVPNYPENVDEPRVVADSISDSAFMFLGVRPLDDQYQGPQIEYLRDWVDDNIATRLGRVKGVSAVGARTGVRRQIHIFIDPEKLASRRLSIADVRNALRRRNRDVSGGDLDFGKRRYLLRTIGRFSDLSALNQLIIAKRNGAFIRLNDVGYADIGYEEARVKSYFNGEFQVMLSVGKLAGANVIQIKKDILQVVEQLNDGPLKDKGLFLELLSEDVQYVEQSIATVIKNLAIGALLSGVVLRLFLRSASATLIGTIGLPICVMAAFLGLSLTGRSINVISLSGVAFAIGMTLDNSIVALESITRHLSLGKTRSQATYEGVREVWPAILASTLTTVMVFLPVIFLEMEAGQLYSDIAVGISSSIIMSMLVAITIIPIACRRFLKAVPDISANTSSAEASAQPQKKARLSIVISLMRWMLQSTHRRLMVLVTTVGIVVAIFTLVIPPAEYLPEGEEAKIFTYISVPAGYNLNAINTIWEKVGATFTDQVKADRSQYERGETSIPPLASSTVILRSTGAGIISDPIDSADSTALIKAATEVFNNEPGIGVFSTRGSIFSDNNGGTRSINMEMSGNNLVELYGVALKVFNAATTLFEGAQVNTVPSPSALNLSQPMLELHPDWERANELGIRQDELGYSVAAFSDGAFIDEYFMDDDKLDMYLFAEGKRLQQPQDLENIMLFTRSGVQIPLSAVARLKETVSSSGISRVNGQRTVTLSIIPPRHVALASAVEQVQTVFIPKLKAEGILPPSIMLDISGASSSLAEAQSAMSGYFFLAIFIAYLLMVAVFSHWGYPLIIMTIVPIGVGGGVLGLALFNGIAHHLNLMGGPSIHQPFDVITMLGFLVLIGTVVNNPILIVERTVNNIQSLNMTTIAAIEEAVKVRLRPIMMSTITTVCGLSPLVFLPGEGTELYRGLGTIVLFGLLFSSVITLTVLPVLLSIILDIGSVSQLFSASRAKIPRFSKQRAVR